MGFETMQRLGGLSLRANLMQERIAELERQLAAATGRLSKANLYASASEKVRLGLHLTRPEAAAFLCVSPKKVQRMDAAGTLARCPGLGTVVRYAASDVLRLASAQRKER